MEKYNTAVKYAEALMRTNNNELAFTEEEKAEFEAFFRENPELEQMRQDLLASKVPEPKFKEEIINYYLGDLAKYQDIEGQLKDMGFNLDGVKDITLSNDKRIIVFYTQDSPEPTVIEFDKDKNLSEELRQLQLDYKDYQGKDANFNAEEMLKTIAKENKLYVGIRFIEGYVPSDKYAQDKEKLTIIAQLIEKAKEQNSILTGDDRFMYIDEENNFIMSKNGRVLEAKKDELTGEYTVQSPESEKEFKDDTITEEDALEPASKPLETSTELQDSSYSFDQPDEVKPEEDKYEQAFQYTFVEGEFPEAESKRDEIIENLKKIDEGSMSIDDISELEREWYQKALDKSHEYEMTMENTRTYRFKPKEEKKSNSEEGSSTYLYIALVVLLIAFGIFMYIILRR